MASRGGIFCIENWSGSLTSNESVRPLLDFLERHEAARVIHQRVTTRQELAHYLGWFSALDSYPVGYLAFHGNAGGLFVGSDRVPLETLTAWSTLEKAPNLDGMGRPTDWVLDLKGKVLYLGSCSTLQITPGRMREFREAAGLRMVCGYTKPVEWFSSAGFDVILLSALAEAMAGDDQQRRLRATVRRLWRTAGDLMDHLGFISEPGWSR